MTSIAHPSGPDRPSPAGRFAGATLRAALAIALLCAVLAWASPR
ncbi:MAG TPA: hypothetical protein VHN98_07960 [Acidimicrobiales bacterium]|nr:hypothetical protein [Acidimicrobiales bacterium]